MSEPIYHLLTLNWYDVVLIVLLVLIFGGK